MYQDRWTQLRATSPSGKTLFSCGNCGRVSPAPDDRCPVPEYQLTLGRKVDVPCHLWPITWEEYVMIKEGEGGILLIATIVTSDGVETIRCPITKEALETITTLKTNEDLRTRTGRY